MENISTQKGIIAFLVAVFLLSNTVGICTATTPISSQYFDAPKGRIVVLSDDWTLGNYWGIGDTLQFTSNTFTWLTEHATPDVQNKILIDKNYSYVFSGNDISKLLFNLTSLGYHYDLVSPGDWTPELLSSYGAVLLERGQFTGAYNSTIIKSYILNGGGILVIGGAYPSNIEDQNMFLNSFGLQVDPPIIVGYQDLTDFVSHPVTQDVSCLATLNPTPITLVPEELEFVQEPQVLAQKLGYNWLAVWDATIPATINIDPDTLNLKSAGKGITCYIKLPEGYDVKDINVSSIELSYGGFEVGGEYGEFDPNELMVKFDRSAVQDLIGSPGDAVELTVTGELNDGTPFKGSDTIRVI